ncbi:unnamed protein product, partial [Didymodactylos carnosus]
VQKYLYTKPQNTVEQTSSNSTLTIDYYKLSIPINKIYFVDNTENYNRLLDKLWSSNDLIIGFDCEWKPMFNNSRTSK